MGRLERKIHQQNEHAFVCDNCNDIVYQQNGLKGFRNTFRKRKKIALLGCFVTMLDYFSSPCIHPFKFLFALNPCPCNTNQPFQSMHMLPFVQINQWPLSLDPQVWILISPSSSLWSLTTMLLLHMHLLLVFGHVPPKNPSP